MAVCTPHPSPLPARGEGGERSERVRGGDRPRNLRDAVVAANRFLCQAKHVAGSCRQARARLRAGEPLLIDLLALASATEVCVQRPSADGTAVQRTAMPEMTVENDDRAGGCPQRYLVRMRRGGVAHLVLR